MMSFVPRSVAVLLGLAIVACARSPQPDTEPVALFPAEIALRTCATAVAVSEGFVAGTGGNLASSRVPGDSAQWVEWLTVHVRVTSDSVLPDAEVRRARYNQRDYYPLSAAARRIQDRVNQECRVSRVVDR